MLRPNQFLSTPAWGPDRVGTVATHSRGTQEAAHSTLDSHLNKFYMLPNYAAWKKSVVIKDFILDVTAGCFLSLASSVVYSVQ